MGPTIKPRLVVDSWLDKCILSDGKNPKPLPIVANALIALRNDPAVRDALGYDEMLCAPTLLHEIGLPLGGNLMEPRPLADKDVIDIQEWMQDAGLKRLARETVRDAIMSYARDHAYHPVRDYLERLQWDGRPRINVWLTTKLGAEMTKYTQAVGTIWQGVEWWPHKQFERELIQPEQAARYEGDAWEEPIANYLMGATKTTIGSVATNALGIKTDRLGTADQRRIAAIMTTSGWRRSDNRGSAGERFWEKVT